jgi:uncharacterized membrane protein
MRPPVEFRNGLRVAGHPLHALLVHFPIAFWSLVFPLELSGWWLGWDPGWRLAFLANAAGLVGAVAAALTGLPDLMALSDNPKASAAANLHMIVMTGALAIFASEIWLRHGPGPASGPRVFAILGLSLSGTLVLLWGGWLGGELVFRHGAGRAEK